MKVKYRKIKVHKNNCQENHKFFITLSNKVNKTIKTIRIFW